MSKESRFFEQVDNDMLVQMVMDGFRRIIVHYGAWFAEVAHQVGLEKAMEVENNVWQASIGNQVDRLGKTLGFPTDNGLPSALLGLPRETLVDLIEKLSINWLANDGIWFQAVEKQFGKRWHPRPEKGAGLSHVRLYQRTVDGGCGRQLHHLLHEQLSCPGSPQA
jgi:hypothetical protein